MGKERRTPGELAEELAALVPARTLAWFSKLRLRVLAWLLAVALAAVAVTTFVGGVGWVPVVGIAVTAAAVSLSKLTTRLAKPTCYGCGGDLSGRPIGVHGVACPSCGAVNQPLRVVSGSDESAGAEDSVGTQESGARDDSRIV